MNIFRRTLIATAPAALGVLLFAGGASATTLITGSTSTFGNLTPSIVAPGSGSTSAGQFDQVTLDAAIQTACPAGFTCSGSTLTEIDFTLQVNLTASVTLANSNAGTAYVGPISGEGGTFGSPTSGFAIAQVTTVDLNDPVTGEVVEDIPTFSAPTTNEFKSSTCTGTAVASAYTNCLAVAHSGQTFTGTGTDTETGSYFSGDLDPTVLAAYVCSGTCGSVTFGLTTAGGTNNGRLPAGVTITANTATILALANALQVTYDYTYTETAVSSAPEPATMALVGGALLAIGMFRKKRIS